MTSVTAPPCQMMRRSATRRRRCTVMPISAMTARMSCLRSRNVVVGASKIARMSAPAVAIQASSCSVNATGRRARWAARSFSAARTRGQLGLQVLLQGPGDQTVLRFDGVELAARPVGLVAGAFDGQLEHRQVASIVGVGLGEGLGGRGQRRRLPARRTSRRGLVFSSRMPPMLWQTCSPA